MSKTFLEEVQKSNYIKTHPMVIKQNGKLKMAGDLLDQSECINIQNVFDYVLPLNNQEGGKKWELDEFPNIAPPFETFFLEYKFIDGYRSGILAHYEQREDKTWLACFQAYSEQDYGNGREIIPAPFAIKFLVSNMGKIVNFDKVTLTYNGKDVEYKTDDLYFWGWVMVPSLLAISFMHCKNVSLNTNALQHAPGKRNRYGPKITFKTLVIKPMQKILSTEGDIEHTGLKRALHICRGHFKNFDNKGLFGKYPGTYWWADQVRGKIENGIVEKDYSVRAE